MKRADLKLLQQAQLDDQRHRLHAEAAPDAASASPYFRKWVAEYLEPTIPSLSTREQVLRDIVWPLVSNELVDDISDSAAAVHGAQDRYIAIELSDEELQTDAEQFIEDIDVAGFISQKCHNALFSAPNSLVVVDLPAEQTTDFPEPYVYLLPSDKIVAAEGVDAQAGGRNTSGLLRFAYFDIKQPKRRALFDGENFQVYEKLGGESEWRQLVSVPHGLPFCPAWKLWADVDAGNPLASNTMIRPSLGLLNRYIFWDAAEHSNDLKAAFAQFWHLEEEAKSCGYQAPDGPYCQEGVLLYPGTDTMGNYTPDMAPIKRPCPQCKKRRSRGGPGSGIPIPAPQKKEDADWRVPAGWIDAPIDSLKYIQEKVEKLRAKIRRTATGSEGGPQNQQALNESQIMSILESARQVGDYLAEYFEILHRRILDALLRLRYGNAYLGCTVNYGRRFSVLSGDLLMQLSEMAKKTGSDWLVEEIDNLQQDYYARGDSSRGLRFQMLTDLNPYPYRTPEGLVAGQINVIDPEGYAIAVGLMGYVKRFERENQLPIERFGVLAPYSQRVTTILDAIKEYVTERNPQQTSGNPQGGANSTGSGPSGAAN
ncbi:hypothetical protein [Spirosoma spitsbergense]|uniref:hypothetical protein n=1 Tax=Spirosoma spitsbergense TaxID=431554 RepID=UPI0003AA4DD7|nr:hypothetical protein [Spirosoma spitsbergense]